VVINNFNIGGIAASPYKAHTPLVIDANTVLAYAVTLQSLKSVVWRYAQVIQSGRPVQHLQLALSNRPKVYEPCNRCTAKQGMCIGAFETLDHGFNCITQCVKFRAVCLRSIGASVGRQA